MLIDQSFGQGWSQIGQLALAFVLSMLIGLEREIHHKSAGLRTYTIVGVSSALIMLISKYGFIDVLDEGRVAVDPSRVAAQIVSGIGFIGGGLIFVRHDSVKGLTTAAIVWLAAAIGMACGAGLHILAITVTGIHFVIIIFFPYIEETLPRSKWTLSSLRISCVDTEKIIHDVLVNCSHEGFVIACIKIIRPLGNSTYYRNHIEEGAGSSKKLVDLLLEVQGSGSLSKLAMKISCIDGVVAVDTGDGNISSS